MNWWVLRREIHSSWLLALVAGAVVTGVATAQWAPQGLFASAVWLASGLALMLTALWRRHAWMIMLALAGGLLIGLWRGSIDQVKLTAYDGLFGHDITLSGVVYEDPDVDASGNLTLRLSAVRYDDRELPGMVWVSVRGESPVQRSDEVTLRGKLQPGFGNFAGVMYRAEVASVQRPVPGDVALAVRDWFAGAVRTVIPEPQASLGLGYLLGQRRALPTELAEALQIAGLTHVIVASGYNLTILVRLARRLFVRVSKYLSVLAAGGMVVSFIAVTGMSPSMARAGLVTGLSLLAWYYGRKFHPLVLLPLAAATTVLVNPTYAWGDVGWQLSFAAFAGVMILAPLLQRYFFGEAKPGNIRQIMGETISAQIATLPILVVTFGQFSNVAIIANLLVLPLVPLAMLLTFIAGIGALALPFAGALIALPATWLLGYMTTTASYLANLPWAISEVSVTWWHAAVAYAALIGVCIYLWRTTGYNLRDSNIVE